MSLSLCLTVSSLWSNVSKIYKAPLRLLCSFQFALNSWKARLLCLKLCWICLCWIPLISVSPQTLSTFNPLLPLSLCQNCRRQLRGAGGTGAAVIIDNYADLLTGCQQFVLSKLAAHRPPTDQIPLGQNSPGDSPRNPGSCQNLPRSISANSDPNIKLISWRSRCRHSWL